VKALAVFPNSREVKITQVPGPIRTLPDQVKIRILDVGICGTDREICNFEYGAPPLESEFLVIGHEALAEVVETGPEVEHLRTGDLVVPSVRRPCSDPGCLACRLGHQDYCYTGKFLERGISGAHGYMTEYVVDCERYLSLVPSELKSVAVLTEPLTVAEKAMQQIFWMMQRRPPWISPETSDRSGGIGLSALVLGVGPVGLLGAMRLAVAGFSTYVYSREIQSPRTDLVTAFGATYVSSQESTFEELAAGIGNIDLIYEAVGHSHFALEALSVLGTNGIYIMTGVPGVESFVQIDSARIMREMVLRNQLLLGTVNAGPEAFASALRSLGEFCGRWPEVVRELVAGRYPLEQATELIFGRSAGVKTVISF
jgi:glucose 1-dehydrogenase